MTRKEVEDYLKAKSIKFGQICCAEDERSTLADLIRIGQEHAPWFCEEQIVYVAFQFAAVERHKPYKGYDSDTLKKIIIFHHLEGGM